MTMTSWKTWSDRGSRVSGRTASQRRRLMAVLRMAHRVLGMRRKRHGLGELGVLRSSRSPREDAAALSVSTLALAAGVLIAPALLPGAGGEALAADECGLPVAGVVTCDTTTYTTGPADDIVYSASTDLTVNVNDPALMLNTTSTAVTILGSGSNHATINFLNGTAATNNYGAPVLTSRNLGLGDATVTLTAGSISTPGTDSSGLYAYVSNAASSATASITMDGGSVTATGGNSNGLYALQSGSGDATVVLNDGYVSTTGIGGRGIFAHIANAVPGSSGETSVTMNGGTVVTTAQGLFSQSNGFGDATVTLTGGAVSTTTGHVVWSDVRNPDSNATALTTVTGGKVTAAGTGYGLVSTNYGLGDARTTLTAGDVSTTGTNANGIFTSVSNVASTATASTRMDGGTVITVGKNAYGIQSVNYGFGDAAVVLTGGRITTKGPYSVGVNAFVAKPTSTGTASIAMIGGAVTTTNTSAHGLYSHNFGLGEATIMLTAGDVSTSGMSAYGAYTYVDYYSGTISTATASTTMNGGTVTTTGGRAHGLYSKNFGLGAAAVTLTAGDVSTTGVDAYGLGAAVNRGGSTATASTTVGGGTVTTTGGGAHGVYSVNYGLGEATTTLTAGEVSTTGDNATGLYAAVQGYASTATASTTMGGGTVTTTGGGAHGVYSVNYGLGEATTTLTAGEVSTTGDNATGLYAYIYNFASTASASAMMDGGTVTTTGKSSYGLKSIAYSSGAATTTLTAGHVSTKGTEAAGLGAISITGTASVTMAGGKVTAAGSNADGIWAQNLGAGVFDVGVTGGTLTSGTGQAAAIHTTGTGGGTVTIGTAAVVDGSASGIAIRDGDGDHDGIDETGGNVVVTTAGTVTGDAVLGLGDDTFNLKRGGYTGTIYGDDKVASAMDGNDAFAWTGGVLVGGFNGGNGSDTAVVTAAAYDGTQVLDGGDDVSSADGWVDTLALNGVTATVNGANLENWEILNLINSTLTLNDLVSGTVNTCGGSTTLGGASAVTDVLGCASNDKIIVTDDTQIANVIEGAGGADTISVLGHASVATAVYGGGDGSDMSASIDGNDVITIATTGTVGLVDAGAGDDTVALNSGTVTGDVLGQSGNDTITLAGAAVGGNVDGGAGDDMFSWVSGTLKGFLGGNGSDTAVVTAAAYDGTQVLDGGDDVSSADGWVDTLALNGVTATVNGANLKNWEILNLINSTLTLNDLVSGTVNTCGGSTTLGGASAVTDVLGCASNDKIIVTDDTQIANVIEGAGGADTISVLGHASVATAVYGGGDGSDMSASIDGNDVITIATTGTVGLVDAGAGDDTVALNSGTVTGDVLGQSGNDTITLAGAAVGGNVDGGAGDDMFSWVSGTLKGFLGGNGSDTAVVTAAAYDGTQVLDGGDDVSSADGWVDTLTLRGVNVTTNGSALLNWENLVVDGGSATFADGALTVGSDAGTGLTIIGGGLVDGGNAFALTGNMNVDPASIFQGLGGGAGVYSVSGNLTNGGIVTMQDGAAGDLLSVGGNYVGNGGSLQIDTVLGDDASASDQLVVNGNATGATNLYVTNAAGTGAQTTTGILVVDVKGTSDAGAFTLGAWDYTLASNEHAIVAGAYGYALRQFSNSWYLQSSLLSLPPEPEPLYQPGAPIYESYAQALQGMNGVPTLQQRVGNRFWKPDGMPGECLAGEDHRAPTDHTVDAGCFTTEGDAVWTRIDAAWNHTEPAASTTGVTGLTQNRWKLEAGADGLLAETDGGKLIAGLSAHYGTSSTRISSPVGDGSISATGYGFGGSLTWYGDNGFYVDGQARATWYDSDLNSDVLGSLAKGNNGFGYALSMEAGRRIDAGEGLTVTPQAQLVYSAVDFTSFTGPNDEAVSLRDDGSLKGRLGVSLDKEQSWQGDDGEMRRSHLYGLANLHYEFLNGTTVAVSGTDLAQRQDRLAGEIGVGGSYNWAGDKYSLYGEISAITSLEDFAKSYNLKGNVGLRVRF